MSWPSRTDYIERGASIPSWAGGPSNSDLPPSEGPRACFDCGCSEDDHNFGIHFRAYHERLIAEGEATRDRDPNPCLNCGACGRDGDGE